MAATASCEAHGTSAGAGRGGDDPEATVVAPLTVLDLGIRSIYTLPVLEGDGSIRRHEVRIVHAYRGRRAPSVAPSRDLKGVADAVRFIEHRDNLLPEMLGDIIVSTLNTVPLHRMTERVTVVVLAPDGLPRDTHRPLEASVGAWITAANRGRPVPGASVSVVLVRETEARATSVHDAAADGGVVPEGAYTWFHVVEGLQCADMRCLQPHGRHGDLVAEVARLNLCLQALWEHFPELCPARAEPRFSAVEVNFGHDSAQVSTAVHLLANQERLESCTAAQLQALETVEELFPPQTARPNTAPRAMRLRDARLARRMAGPCKIYPSPFATTLVLYSDLLCDDGPPSSLDGRIALRPCRDVAGGVRVKLFGCDGQENVTVQSGARVSLTLEQLAARLTRSDVCPTKPDAALFRTALDLLTETVCSWASVPPDRTALLREMTGETSRWSPPVGGLASPPSSMLPHAPRHVRRADAGAGDFRLNLRSREGADARASPDGDDDAVGLLRRASARLAWSAADARLSKEVSDLADRVEGRAAGAASSGTGDAGSPASSADGDRGEWRQTHLSFVTSLHALLHATLQAMREIDPLSRHSAVLVAAGVLDCTQALKRDIETLYGIFA